MSFGPILRFLFWAPLCCTLSARAGALTWDDAIKCADQNNSEIQAARASAEAAKFSAQAAQGTYFPAIAGSLGYTRSNSSSASPSTEASNAYSATLSASQNIFNGLQDQAHVAQARASLQSAEAALNIAKAKASYDLKSAYSNLQFALKSIKLQQDILKRREDNARMVELRFEGGRENRGSVLLSVAYLNQAKLEALQAKNNLTEARRQLLRVLGTEAEIASDAQITSQTPEENPAIEDLARNTPEYLQSTAQETSAKAAVAVARGGFFPTLGANLSLGKQGPDWFPENSRWSAGLNLSVPLFNGGHDYYGLRAASASLEASSATLQNLFRAQLSKLQQAYNNFAEAFEKLKVDESFLKAASTREEIARNKYNNGLATFDDWDLVEGDLIARQKAFIASQRDRVIAEAAWEQAQGKGVFK